MNCYYGYRIRKAFESEENWYTINRYGAKALMCWSVIIMAIGIVCLYIEPQPMPTVAKLSLSICDCPHCPNLPVRKAAISHRNNAFAVVEKGHILLS